MIPYFIPAYLLLVYLTWFKEASSKRSAITIIVLIPHIIVAVVNGPGGFLHSLCDANTSQNPDFKNFWN
jgi:hypothetical protein